MWIGTFINRSHVDTVGRQRQPSWQPWTNIKDFLFENPRTGVVLVPDIHFSKSPIDISVILQAMKMSDKIKAQQCPLNNVF